MRADDGIELVRIDRFRRIPVTRGSDRELSAVGVQEARAKSRVIAQHAGVVVGCVLVATIRTKGVIELDRFALDDFVRRERCASPGRRSPFHSEICIADDRTAPIAFKRGLGKHDAGRHLIFALNGLPGFKVSVDKGAHIGGIFVMLRGAFACGAVLRDGWTTWPLPSEFRADRLEKGKGAITRMRAARVSRTKNIAPTNVYRGTSPRSPSSRQRSLPPAKVGVPRDARIAIPRQWDALTRRQSPPARLAHVDSVAQATKIDGARE